MLGLLFTLTACSDIHLKGLPQPTDASNLVLIIHGSGDSAEAWPTALQQKINEHPFHEHWDVWTYDWAEEAESKLSASSSGLQLGELIAQELLENPYDYQHLHLVAHSVGSFVLHGLSGVLSEESNIEMHSTYLDPFTGNGVFDWSYGERHFGRHEDFAEAYYNLDDSVPSTNGMLEHAHNFDVTPLRPSDYDEDSAHWWPTDYYINSVLNPELIGYGHANLLLEDGLETLKQAFPKGAQTQLN